MLLVKKVTVNFIKINICELQVLLCDYNIIYYLCDLEKMILCNFLNELDSYNSMNAAYKVQHAVRTPHASSEKKYSLVVFYQDANKVWSLLSVAINARAYYLKICMKLGHGELSLYIAPSVICNMTMFGRKYCKLFA